VTFDSDEVETTLQDNAPYEVKAGDNNHLALQQHCYCIPSKNSPAVKKGDAKNAQVTDFGV